MDISILILAADPAASKVAAALRQELDAQVEVAAGRRACLNALRRSRFDLLLLEESLGTTDPAATEMLYEAAGTTPVLEVNFALCTAERIARQARRFLALRTADEARARTAAVTALQQQLNASLAGLLLESQLALRHANPEMAPALRRVVELAGELRGHLQL